MLLLIDRRVCPWISGMALFLLHVVVVPRCRIGGAVVAYPTYNNLVHIASPNWMFIAAHDARFELHGLNLSCLLYTSDAADD